MAITVGNSATNYVYSSPPSIQVNAPAGCSDGDILLVFMVTNGASLPSITDPANWTTVGTDRTEDTYYHVRYHVAWKEFQTGETSYTWTLTNAATAEATIIAFTGVDTTTPINANNGTANVWSANLSVSQITTTVDNCMVILFSGNYMYSGITWSAQQLGGSNMTEAFDNPNTYNGSAGAYLEKTSAGATGAGTATASASCDCYGGFLLALAPIVAGVTGVILDGISCSTLDNQAVSGIN